MLFLGGVISSGCSNSYDDSALWNSVSDLENRVVKLEELCCQMNVNISSLREIVTALQKNETIKSVESLPDGSGYQITFSSNKKIIVYHGKDGIDGEDGKNGANGITPVISVKKDIDGIYYWVVNGEWLLVEGKKVRAEGTNGADGIDGKPGEDGLNGVDGVTPKFKIENEFWYISYDNQQSWIQLGRATGDSGLNGADGDNFFKGVSVEDGYVCFVLNDGDSTEIKIPFYSGTELEVHVAEPGTLKELLTDEQKRTVLSLKVTGKINDLDIQNIDAVMLVVEKVDLSETNIVALPLGAFCGGYNLLYGKQTLKEIILPSTCIAIYDYAFYGCRNLTSVIAPGLCRIGHKAFCCCNNLTDLTMSALIDIPQKEFYLFESAFYGCNNLNFRISYLPDVIVNSGFFAGRYRFIPIKNLYISANICEIEGATFASSTIEKIIFAPNSKLEKISTGITANNSWTGAFSDCLILESLEIPSTVISIGRAAFKGCSNLKIVTSFAVIPPSLEYECFSGISDNAVLYVPSGSLELYKNSDWNDYFSIFTLNS